jgi:hypothetical protein
VTLNDVVAVLPLVSFATKLIVLFVADVTSTSFNVTIKPLRDKYRVGTSSTAANPVRIANISNKLTLLTVLLVISFVLALA